MKSIRNVLASLIVFGGFVASINLLYAQETGTLAQSETGSVAATTDASALSDVEVEVKAVEMTTPLPAAAAPESGNFYSTQHLPGTADEWPPLPADTLNLPVWPLGDDFYLLADENVDYAALQTQSLSASGGMRAMTDFAPLDLVSSTLVAGTNLWLAITNLADGTAGLRLSNTLADVEYEIQATTNLTQSQWNSIGTVLGSEITNWTAASVAAAGDPALFLRVRSDLDSDNIGIPDWWQLEYFGYVGIDPNGDPAGDGWSNAQKYEYGMNPKSFDAPPAPQGVTVTYNPGNNMATVSWLPSPGPVTGYTVSINSSVNYGVASSANSFQIAVTPGNFYSELGFGDPNLAGTFQVRADYADGNSAWSASVPLEANAYSLSIHLIPGQQSSANLVVSALPPGAVKLRVTRVDAAANEYYGDASFDTDFDLPVALFTNGLYVLPPALAGLTPVDSYGNSDYEWWVQTVDANGNISGASLLSYGYSDDVVAGGSFYSQSGAWPVTPYFDGRVQLKQNLIFQLRGATAFRPFQFEYDSGEYWLSISNPTNYAYSGFYQFQVVNYDDGTYNYYAPLDPFLPFEVNALDRNFVFDSSSLDSNGRLTTGAGGSFDPGAGGLTLSDPITYQFQQPPTNGAAISSLLAAGQTRWLATFGLDSSYTTSAAEIGITVGSDANYNENYTLAGDAENIFGLPFLSAEIAYSGGTATLNAGGDTTQGGYFYPETAQPQFQTVEYDFWPAPTYLWPTNSFPGLTNIPTAPNPLLITSVGNANFILAGYAKLAVTNGYPGVYGYLGQYFDQAYQIDTNGMVTTNTTGILSPYGQFFATQPGPVALVTMPDPDTGERGTCTVYAVSLNLDANHDGTMDTSFNGPDQTSPNNPYVFWADNNYDRWTPDKDDGTNYMDDVQIGDCPYTPNVPTPDCNYRDVNGNRAIPCTRDLEDFSRLWISGVTSNLLAALPPGGTITLGWANVWNGSEYTQAGSPTIDLFAAADTDGGIGYLTNSAIATNQIDPSQSGYMGRVAPGVGLQLNTIQFANNWAGNHFIWCGVSNGVAQLNLTIADANGNVLGQASQWIQIVDIKQMYERWTVGDDPNVAPTNTAYLATDDLPTNPVVLPFEYTPPTDTSTPYILFVHGWNMEAWEKDRFAETAFKRLYWQGYPGRFGEFRWPTGNGISDTLSAVVHARNYDNSESNAWASATGLLNKLNDLNIEYPNRVYLMAHSMGNVVAGEALRQAGANQVANTYVAMQGAISAHGYDPNTPVWTSNGNTPDIYANYWTNGDSCYFNGTAGAGTYVNFFNTGDYALNLWTTDQYWKPDHGISGYPGYYYSTPSDIHPSGFYKIVGATSPDVDLYFPANNYEILAYGVQSQSYALGATADVGGVFSTNNQINLPSVWPPDPTQKNYVEHFWHSAEFRTDNPSMWQFWQQVLTKMKLN